MDTDVFKRFVRRYFSEGLSGKEEFELELEAGESAEAKAVLEQAERDDENIHLLRQALAQSPTWYQSKIAAMAASAALAVGVTLLSTSTPVMVGGTSGLASSNVVYLETFRSATGVVLPTVVVGSQDEWITLIAYPAYDGFTEFRINVDRMIGDDPQVANSPDATWTQVWQSHTGIGNEDALAINVASDVLDEGIYRLHIEGLEASSGTYLSAAKLLFRVTR